MIKETGFFHQIINKLNKKLSSGEIKTWFSKIDIKKIDSQNIVIEAPNKFIASWLKDNYLNDLQNSIKEIIKSDPKIIFNNSKASKKTKLFQTQHKKPSDLFLKNSLNKYMTFEGFTLGKNNRFAYTSAYEVAHKPGILFNPLFIFSKLSLGKTHLLHAIGNHLLLNKASLKIGYISSSHFILDYKFLLFLSNLI